MAASAIAGAPVIRIVAQGGGEASTQMVSLPTVLTLDPVCTPGTATVNALLNADVDAKGVETTAMFRYKTVGGVSIASQPFDLPAAFGVVRVSVEVQGLAPDTAYSVTAYAWHKYGIFGGMSQSGGAVLFDTPSVAATTPPLAVTEAPLVIGSTTATIHGRVNPVGSTTGYYFTLTGPGGVSIPTAPLSGALTGTSFIDVQEQIENLQPDSIYTYTLTAENVYGQSATGLPITFSTNPVGAYAPTVQDPTLNFVTDTTAQVRVFFDTGGDTCQLTVYGTVPIPVVVTVAPSETFRDVLLQFLSASTAYSVIAKIENSVGEDTSGTLAVTTSGAVAAPEGDTALPEKIGQTFATLRALFDPNLLSTSVTFYYAKSQAELLSTPQSISADATSSVDILTAYRARISGSYVQPYTLYYYYAKATNSAGSTNGQVGVFRTAGNAAASICTVAANTPATYVTDTAMTLTGTVTHSGVPTSYYFEWWLTGSESTTKKFTPIKILDFPIGFGSVTLSDVVSERIYGLTANTGYTYRLVAVNAGDQNHQTSTPDRAQTTAIAPVAFPATGTVGYPTVISATSVSVGGTVNTLGSSTDVRAEASTTPQFTAVAAFSATSTFADSTSTQAVPQLAITGLTANTTYHFRLRYVNDSGTNTSYSYNSTSALTNGLSLPTLGATSETNVTANSFNVQLNVTLPADIGTDLVYVWAEYGTAAGVYSQHTAHLPLIDGGGNPLPAGVYQQNIPIAGLTAGTTYYYSVGARRAGVNQYVYTAEDNRATSGGAASNLSVLSNLSTAQSTPYSFYMRADLETNGDDVEVEFEYWCVSLGETFASPRITATQTITDSAHIVKVGAHTHGTDSAFGTTPLLPSPPIGSFGYRWEWQVRTTQGGEELISAVQTLTLMPPSATVDISTKSGAMNVDSRSGHARWGGNHVGQRVFMQMEYGTTTALGTFSRWVSLRGSTANPHWSYSDYMDGLTPNTTYYCKLWCWSSQGDHTNTGSATQFTTGVESATPSGAQWSTSWLASVGTQFPFRGQRGPVPQNLRTGAGTRQYPRTATEHLVPATSREVVWGADGYDASEAAYTIHVTPTAVTTTGHTALGTTNLARTDSLSTGNLAYAARIARIGDIIRVDGSVAGFEIRYRKNGVGQTAPTEPGISQGQTVTSTPATGVWTAYVHQSTDVYYNNPVSGQPDLYDYSYARLRYLTGTLPPRGTVTAGVMAETSDINQVGSTLNIARHVTIQVSGKYTYTAVDFGDGTGGADAYWGATSATRKPVTGLRIQAEVADQKYQIRGWGGGPSEGGFNGIFFKDVIMELGSPNGVYNMSTSGGVAGVGVYGMSDFESRGSSPDVYQGFGIKSHFRPNCPSTPDLRRGIFTPSNEHFFYGNSVGANGNGDWFIADCTLTGTSGDELKIYSGRTFYQGVARGSSDSENDPGRGTGYILRNTWRGSDNGSPISIWGHFGTVYVDGFTHSPIPTSVAAGGYANASTNGMLICKPDSGKGAWCNENGYATNELQIGTLIDAGSFSAVGNTSLVNTSEAPFYQIQSVERAYIGSFTFGSTSVAVNNKDLFGLMHTDGLSWDNGIVQFSGNYGAASGGFPGLWTYVRWTNYTANVFDNRIKYNKTLSMNGTAINSVAGYEWLIDGVQFTAII